MLKIWYGMFDTDGNLIEVPNFATTTVINIGSMFSQCYNLINIPNYDFSKVEDAGSFL